MARVSLLEKYKQGLEIAGLPNDPAQQKVVRHLQRLADQLTETDLHFHSKLFSKFLGRKSKTVPGIYLWGGVGRGKTYLMDLFYNSLPFENKTRIHFHRFMQSIHADLKGVRRTEDPLSVIGKNYSRQFRLLCLDEFHVLDIGDAVILARLLNSLIENKVVLVTTSNIKPDNLYPNGIQRDRFMPAIRLIHSNMNVVHLADGIDYRLRDLSEKKLFYDSLGPDTDRSLLDIFEQWRGDETKMIGVLEILGRYIPTVCYTDNVVWFSFSDICDGPRSKADYIEIANVYRTVMVSEIPVLTWEHENQARRFIELIDEFYDRGVHLIASAATNINSLYAGKHLIQEYQRTSSRLHEMQTDQYLSRAHHL